MAHITTAGVTNWRAAFEGHPGLAVTPEHYEALLDAAEAAAEPEPEAVPEAVPDPSPEPDSTPPLSSPEPSEAPSDPEPELVRLSDGDGGLVAE